MNSVLAVTLRVSRSTRRPRWSGFLSFSCEGFSLTSVDLGPPIPSMGTVRSIVWTTCLAMILAGSTASAQQGCPVVMPMAFRLLERQAVGSPGISYPRNTTIRAITFGSARQGANRVVRARIDTAEGWVFLSPMLVRACPPGSIAERAGDVVRPSPLPTEPQRPAAPAPEPQVVRVCTPGATQACLCVGGGSGVQSCVPSGAGYDACVCVQPTAPPPAHALVPTPPAAPEAPTPTPPPAVPTVPPTNALRRLLAGALNASLALQVRQLTHPSGGGGSLGPHAVTCSEDSCVAAFAVLWTGGVFGSAYQTNVRWTVSVDGSSSAQIVSENSIVGADGPHIAAMGRYLAGIASRFSTHP